MVCLAVMNFSSVQQLRYLLIVLLNLSSLSHLTFSAISITASSAGKSCRCPTSSQIHPNTRTQMENSENSTATAEMHCAYVSSFSLSVPTRNWMSVAVRVFDIAGIRSVPTLSNSSQFMSRQFTFFNLSLLIFPLKLTLD